MSGWIKLHRSIQEHFIYDFSEPDKAMAWVDILLSASYQDSKVKIKSTVLPVKKGQWLVSQVTLQKRWKMSQNKVKRLLLMLKNDGMIELETNELTSIITICNYCNYQDGERAGERSHGRADERGTDEQTNDILRSKEIKEGKELKKKDIGQQADECSEIFSYWCNVMGKSGAVKFTPERKRLIQARLKDGYTVDHIKQAIDGCARSDFHMARDGKNKTVYDDLTLICRNGSSLEKFALNVGGSSVSVSNQIIQGYKEFVNEQA